MVTEEQAIKDGQPTGDDINYHGLGVEGLYALLEKSEHPIAAFADTPTKENKRLNRIVLVTDYEVGEGLGIAIVEVDSTALINKHRVSANKTITAFDKRNAISLVKEAYAGGRLLYIDKKNGQLFNSGVKGANCPTAISEGVRKKNMQDFWANVKWKKSGKQEMSFDGGQKVESSFAAAFKNAGKLRSDRGNITTRSVLEDVDASQVKSEIERKHLQEYQAVAEKQQKERVKLGKAPHGDVAHFAVQSQTNLQSPVLAPSHKSGEQYYLETGKATPEVAKEAGAVLDKILNAEVTWQTLSNSDIAKLMLNTAYGARAVSTALGIPIRKALKTADERIAIRQAILYKDQAKGPVNYAERNAPEASLPSQSSANREVNSESIPGERETVEAEIQRKKKTARKDGRKASEGDVQFVDQRIDRENLSDQQKASVEALEKLAEALGAKFRLFQSETGEDGRPIGANGWYDPKTGEIYIDIQAGENGEGTILFTAAHELTHFIYQWSPGKFKVLADFLVEQYGEKGQSVADLIRAQQAKAKRNGRTLSWMQAYQEMVADSMETMLSDGKVIEKLAELRARDKSLVQKIQAWFKAFAEKLLAAYRNMSPDTQEGKLVAEMVDVTDRLQELFAEGLAEAGENYRAIGAQKNTAEEGGVVYSLREFKDGIRFVDVQADPHIFDGMTVSDMNRTAKGILKKFTQKVIGIDHPVYVNGDSINEYLHPSKSIDVNTRKAKLTAAGELDNLIDAGIPLPNKPDGEDGHIHPGVTDFSYYKTIFKIGNEFFEGIVNIKNIKMRKLLKDITKIRNITQDIVSSYGQNPKSNFLRDASMNSIRNSGEDVNTKYLNAVPK